MVMPNGEISPIIPKREESREDIISSLDSIHDDDDNPVHTSSVGIGLNPEGARAQKRKGGRKPLYATTEERKQRNRRAQAAFRERRTEHIKQLEANITQMQETVRGLEQSQQRAKDECLMLRYKNSLLENLLLQKKINFQKEIQQSGMSYSPQSTPAPSVSLHQSVYQQRMRPSPVTLDAQSPLLSETRSVASASPAQVPTSAFAFGSPTFAQQSASTDSHTNFYPNARHSTQLGPAANDLTSPAITARHQLGQWTTGRYPGGFENNTTSFSLGPGELAHQDSPQASQNNQYQDVAATQRQFDLLAHGQFGSGQPGMNQVLGQNAQIHSDISNQQQPPHQQHSNMNMTQQGYHLMNQGMGYNLAESDPFGIDRSMQYPTHFDFRAMPK